ncbi:MAG: helix-turn-helix transcriptional regulator [Chloroflexi bacterium]|nr:MAG: helix-turn-helix transcriptional regulator [Chloroflexota bacterium]
MLVGRDPELRAIEEALATARLGRSARLVIRGEPGIGKTALLEHATAHAGEMRVLAARGVEFEADVPFAGLHELLLPALAMLDRLPAMHAAALRSSLALGPRIEADRLIVGAAVLSLISMYADDGPLLVMVDDAHWLDRASAEAIAFAIRRLVADPVAVVIAVREGEASPFLAAGIAELSLGGIDAGSAATLLEAAGPSGIAAEQVERLVRATGGNPLALLELARGDLQLSQPLDLPVATSVERSYLRRLESLPERIRQALLLMAASGSSDLALLNRAAAALGIEAADVDEAARTSALVKPEGDRVAFTHPLARAAIYHSASLAQRRATHRALAGASTGPDDIDRRAWHLAAAATGPDSEAAAALEQAAQRARESTGYEAAAGALAEAARLTESVELRSLRFFRAAENSWLAGQAERAVELLHEARKLAQDAELMADIDNLEGHIAMRRGAVMDGYRQMVAAALGVETRDRLKAIRMLADASVSAYGAGHPATTLTAATKALALLKAGDPAEISVFAKVAYGVLAVMAGRGSDGPQRLHESVELFRSIPAENVDPLVWTCAGLAGLWLREADSGRDLLDRTLAQAREHAPTATLPSALFMLGRDAAATDRWELARARYEECARVARETTQHTWLAGAIAGMAWLDALEGREEECRAHAAEARALAERYGMALFVAWSMIALGLLDLGLGRAGDALQHFSSCAEFLEEIAIDDPDVSPLPDMADALVRLGRVAEARAATESFVRSAEAKGQPFSLARAARARALVAGEDGFAGEFDAALRHHEATSDQFERARTELYYGERLRRARRRVEARRHLGAAMKIFEQLGAAPWSDRASSELEATGETARVRDDRYRRQLTPQELQVAMTLAEGLTTREAAARLYLSPKTVEYHLRHVYDKLEIRTRDELRTALAPSMDSARR